jgi:hypothetical protein
VGTSPEVEQFIEHYGVKGMRWGTRRSRSELRKEAKTRKKRTPHEENIELRLTREKKALELSNADLKKAISRMELETKYNNMNPKGLTKGLTSTQKKVGALLALGTTINGVIAFANSPAGKAVASALKKAPKTV